MTRREPAPWRRFLRPLDVLLVFVPVAIALDLLHVSPPLVFLTSAIAIVPLAGQMGRSTEQLAEQVGPGLGGFLNATFGNAAELIIAVIGLSHGLGEVVKASLTGSIIGNCLLVFGLAILMGGVRHPVQRFNRTAASVGSTLMALAAIGLLVPTLFWYAAQTGAAASGAEAHGAVRLERLERGLSAEIAVVLAITYLLSLVFSLRTHKHLYAGDLVHPVHAATPSGGAERRRALVAPVVLLIVSSGLVAVMSESLVGAVEATAHAFGLTDLFIGVIVVAVVGNAAEHSSAILAAWKNQMDLATHIAIGSSLQIALFVTPLVLGLSYVIGPAPIDLHFSLFEVGAVVLGVFAVTLVAQDGESNWIEGVMLLAVYAVLALAFFFLP